MARIIFIETSTALCSTALSDGEKIISYKESSIPRAQASLTAPFVSEMLLEAGWAVKDCDAVCVASGPGSYTGLRVGVSTAKGLCFGADLPLIAVSTSETLVFQAIAKGLPETCRHIVPMIDARRMEVYSGIYSAQGTEIKAVTPVVVDENSYSDILDQGPAAFIGDGALKCKDVIGNENALYYQECPRADSMLIPALKAFKEKRFENTAYFEPFYLKQFVATESKKKLF